MRVEGCVCVCKGGLFGFWKKTQARTERRLKVVYLVPPSVTSSLLPPQPPPRSRPTSESRRWVKKSSQLPGKPSPAGDIL